MGLGQGDSTCDWWAAVNIHIHIHIQTHVYLLRSSYPCLLKCCLNFLTQESRTPKLPWRVASMSIKQRVHLLSKPAVSATTW